MKIRQLLWVPLFVGLLGLAACSSEEAIPTDIKMDSIDWSTCDEYPDEDNLECGVLEVPLDYSDLEGETIEISLIRIPSTSSKIKGVVLSNPGGPGELGVDFVSGWSVEFVENLGLEEFDIVGFDPRGVGHSGGMTCLTDEQFAETIKCGNVNPPFGVVGESRFNEIFQRVGESCETHFQWGVRGCKSF